jgi:hypothetical protein
VGLRRGRRVASADAADAARIGTHTQGWPSQCARPRKASRVSMCGNGHHGHRMQDVVCTTSWRTLAPTGGTCSGDTTKRSAYIDVRNWNQAGVDFCVNQGLVTLWPFLCANGSVSRPFDLKHPQKLRHLQGLLGLSQFLCFHSNPCCSCRKLARRL